MKRSSAWQIGLLAVMVLGLGGTGFIYSGVYNIGADDLHTRWVFNLVEMLRDRSVDVRAASIAVPPLGDSDLLLSGGPDYAEMCSGCHLQPGVKTSEFRDALYPRHQT